MEAVRDHDEIYYAGINDPPNSRNWRDIPGMKYHYQISNLGHVRRLYDDGTPPRKLYINPSSNSAKVMMITKDGKKTHKTISTMMCEIWLGRKDKNLVAYHKNGVHTDNRISNLKLVSRKDSGKMSARKSRSRPVAKIDPEGNIVEVYRSSREAERRNYISCSGIAKRCNGTIQSDLNGYTYRWDKSSLYS